MSAPKTKRVPLGPEDVPPGSLISDRGINGVREFWSAVVAISPEGLRAGDGRAWSWAELMHHGVEISRPQHPSQWAWAPCSKEVPA